MNALAPLSLVVGFPAVPESPTAPSPSPSSARRQQSLLSQLLLAGAPAGDVSAPSTPSGGAYGTARGGSAAAAAGGGSCVTASAAGWRGAEAEDDEDEDGLAGLDADDLSLLADLDSAWSSPSSSVFSRASSSSRPIAIPAAM
jgi:hypothetical protein